MSTLSVASGSTLELSMIVSALRRKLCVCSPYETVEAELVEVIHRATEQDAPLGWYVQLYAKDALGKRRELGLLPMTKHE